MGHTTSVFSSTGSVRSVLEARRSMDPESRYEMGRQLSEGNFGKVRLAVDTSTDEEVAIKFIERGPGLAAEYVIREIINHRGLWHPHIIGFKRVFLTKDALCIVMEYAAGGDMHEYLKKRRSLPECWARWFFQQLVMAIEYCHQRGVVLRDVKLENLLLDKKQQILKLCDFGFSKHGQRHSEPHTCVGTPCYLAPEVLKYPPKHKTYNGVKVDIWTCGVSLFVMLFGHYPFDDPRDKPEDRTRLMLQRIARGVVSIPSHQIVKNKKVEISPDCIDLLERILEPSPSKRISLEAIMAHAWFRESLPQGVEDYNRDVSAVDEDTLVSRRKLQSDSEIEKLVRQATHKERT